MNIQNKSYNDNYLKTPFSHIILIILITIIIKSLLNNSIQLSGRWVPLLLIINKSTMT